MHRSADCVLERGKIRVASIFRKMREWKKLNSWALGPWTNDTSWFHKIQQIPLFRLNTSSWILFDDYLFHCMSIHFLSPRYFACVSTLVIYNIYVYILSEYHNQANLSKIFCFCLWQTLYIHSIWATQCWHRYMWDISILKYNPKISFYRHLLCFEFAMLSTNRFDLTAIFFNPFLHPSNILYAYNSHSTYYALLACEQAAFEKHTR